MERTLSDLKLKTQLLSPMPDPGKVATQLGERWPVPVEAVVLGWTQTVRRLQALGCEPKLREAAGQPFQTDNGNYIVDCRFPRSDDPAELEQAINSTPGVIDCGLFIGLAHRLIVGDPDGRCDVIDR